MTTSTLSDSTRPGKRTWFSHLRLATLVLVFGLAVFEAQAVYTLQNWQYDGEIPQRPLTKMGGSDKYSFAISVVAAVVTLAAFVQDIFLCVPEALIGHSFIAQLVFAAAPPVWVELALTPAVGVLCFIILFVNANIFLGLAPILLFISGPLLSRGV
jgi:hypothetical protein